MGKNVLEWWFSGQGVITVTVSRERAGIGSPGDICQTIYTEMFDDKQEPGAYCVLTAFIIYGWRGEITEIGGRKFNGGVRMCFQEMHVGADGDISSRQQVDVDHERLDDICALAGTMRDPSWFPYV